VLLPPDRAPWGGDRDRSLPPPEGPGREYAFGLTILSQRFIFTEVTKLHCADFLGSTLSVCNSLPYS
jgi:hypothetical protein